jgi:hypothetical protein
MRLLNSITVTDNYPLPHVQVVPDCLANVKYFTSLGFNSGYLKIKFKESDIE